ncbi:response regulator [Roseivirga pacifica]|uniref:response regulator n=1 Tax=Roseivirga pacifica TaxID=1267423 RepID=UPI002094B029|nr:response regulator [Roseivirga pacifica]MCO6357279.1 response regulator [Roseivirga pacifica]MCO6368007.1 response regulator [Roseivirga pacifica]MCO6369511.1 response regulator [Roseivirga pacifica]MCO6373365.1 response regulator [Roseivirga pacifica]MCO6377378.1 response regulator [Roseivirga pacifica]
MSNIELKVLLIDDDRATNLYNKYTLDKMGCCKQINIAENGQEAIDYLTSADADGNHPQPDLIFLDVNMPVMDGWEFLEVYETLPDEQKGENIVIMLTTSVNQDDFQKAESDPHISQFRSKPLTPNMLREIIDEHIASR